MMDCSHCLVSIGVNGGRRSIFVGLAFATALAITIDNVFRSRSCEFVFIISTGGGM